MLRTQRNVYENKLWSCPCCGVRRHIPTLLINPTIPLLTVVAFEVAALDKSGLIGDEALPFAETLNSITDGTWL